MKEKEVPIIASLRWGFNELSAHLRVLLPLSALFFTPQICERFGYRWPPPLSKIFETTLFFILLLRAMKLTKPKGLPPPKGHPLSFALGESLKMLAQGTALLLGAGFLWLYLLWRSPESLAGLYRGSLSQRGQELWQWWKAEPWWSQGSAALLLGWLALRVHVMLNFFGYIVADKGLGAVPALRESVRLVQGVQVRLWAFYALCLLLNLGGFYLYIVGAIYTFPATVLATLFVYRRLAGEVEA